MASDWTAIGFHPSGEKILIRAGNQWSRAELWSLYRAGRLAVRGLKLVPLRLWNLMFYGKPGRHIHKIVIR